MQITDRFCEIEVLTGSDCTVSIEQAFVRESWQSVYVAGEGIWVNWEGLLSSGESQLTISLTNMLGQTLSEHHMMRENSLLLPPPTPRRLHRFSD